MTEQTGELMSTVGYVVYTVLMSAGTNGIATHSAALFMGKEAG